MLSTAVSQADVIKNKNKIIKNEMFNNSNATDALHQTNIRKRDVFREISATSAASGESRTLCN